VPKVQKELSPFFQWVDARASDPKVLLTAFYESWRDTGHPYNVWRAIHVCARHDRPFPKWIRSYLSLCAKRMMDEAKSKDSQDLRAALPRVFGFPARRGRGHPLRPYGDEEYGVASSLFADKIAEGFKPADARRIALDYLDKSPAKTIDDKTFMTHLKKFYGVKKAPRTNAEWRKLINTWYIETFGLLEKEFRELYPDKSQEKFLEIRMGHDSRRLSQRGGS
jgi:hypothetical protein